jgi:hypothetical protein
MRSAFTVFGSKGSPSSSALIVEISWKISAKRSGGILAFRQEVRIARRTITFPRPKFEEQSAFQNKRVPVFGFAQPEEHSFEAILREHKSKVVIPLLRKIE